MKMESRRLQAKVESRRLDQYLASYCSEFSRAEIQRLIKGGFVNVNEKTSKASDRVKIGDNILIHVPEPHSSQLIPQQMDLDIIWEDPHLLIVNKPAGLTVHPAPGHPSHTLVNAMLAIYPNLPGIGGERRPGIVHRLDKDTSGLMLVAKTAQAHKALSNEIKHRRICKGYTALVKGHINSQTGLIDASIARDPKHRKRMAVVDGGKPSKTHYKVVRYVNKFTLAHIYPETGRTHQIRVHMAYMGHPLVGDKLYGHKSLILPHQFLHAHLLEFEHPTTKKYMKFSIPLPKSLETALIYADNNINYNVDNTDSPQQSIKVGS